MSIKEEIEQPLNTVAKRMPVSYLVLFTAVILTLVAVFGTVHFLGLGEPQNKSSNVTEEHQARFQQTLLDTIDELREQVIVLQNRIDTMTDDNVRLTLEMQSLRNVVLAIESANDSAPFSSWVKDRNGVMLYLNDHYVTKFLSCRGYVKEDYLNHDDYAVWPDSIAKRFIENDRLVLQRGKALIFKEQIITCDGGEEVLTFVKWPRKLGALTIGIAGMHLPSGVDEAEFLSNLDAANDPNYAFAITLKNQ